MFTHELKRPRSPVPYILAVTTAIGLAAVLLTPVPRQVRSSFLLEPVGSLEVKASRGGVIASVLPEGRWLEKGAPVATFDPAPSEAKLGTLEAAVKADEAKLKAASAPGRNPAKLKDAVAKAEAAEKQARAALEKAQALKAGAAANAARAAAEKKVAAAEAATKKAREAAGGSPEELKAELTSLQQQIAEVKAELAAPALVAPQAGTLAGLAVKQGQQIAPGTLVARLDDTSTLKVVLQVPKGETLKSGQAVDLTLGTSRKRVHLDSVSGDTAVAQLANAAHEFKAGTDGVAEITGEPRSVIGGL